MKKIKTLQKILLKKNIDFGIFLNFDENKRDTSIFYFCNIDPEFACLIVPKTGKPKLIIAKLEEEIAKKESSLKNITLLEKDFFKQLYKIVGKNKTIGLNQKIVSMNENKILKKTLIGSKIKDISKIMIDLRIEKTEEEIDKIKYACKITDEIFSKIVLDGNKFKAEKDIEKLIVDYAKKNHCEMAFSPIVASGKNSSMPHYKENNSKLNKGFCVIDFGVKYKGYNSDMTRTIYFGKPSEEEINEYYRLLGVQEEAIKKAKARTDFKKIDEGVRKVLGKAFIHSLGHGLGIDVHEKISINPKSSILRQNTVLTIEPGVYYESKFGIRIEDDILVTLNGALTLTKSDKELVCINKSR